MSLPAALRLGAIAICLAGVVDPVLSRSVPARQLLTIAVADAQARSAAERLQALARDKYDARIVEASHRGRAAACPSAGGCVIASRGTVPERLTAGAVVVGALHTADRDRVIDSVAGPSRVHPAEVGILHLRTRRAVQRVDVYDDEALVGFAAPGGTTEPRVSWVPLTPGARRLRVVADGDEAHIGVVVDATPVPVLFYEPEPTWLGTFVRRALQEDARLDLRAVTRVAPAVTISGASAAPLSLAALEDVGVVFATSPDALTAAEIDLLERFVRHRGGSLVVLPDRPLTGSIVRLLPRMGESRRASQPGAVGLLRTSEHVAFEEGPGISVLERREDRAIVVVRDIGRGRVVVSGALDAWRYRDAKGDFAAFWQSLAGDAAAAAGNRLRLSAPRALVRAGDEMAIDVEWQTMAPVPAELTARGAFACGDERGVLRLWPGHRPGTFTTVFRPLRVGPCRLDVSVADAASTLQLLVADDLPSGEERRGRLEAAMAAHGGHVVSAGQEDELAARIDEVLAPRDERQPTRPMRSPWWMLPLLACLGGEWWLRRASRSRRRVSVSVSAGSVS